MAKLKSGKSNSKKGKKASVKKNTVDFIESTRTGGAIALSGFEYQCLYSCYTLLQYLNSETNYIRFEGIEDIDTYISKEEETIHHIQVKYSQDKQDASYFKSILKNYLEVYLCDQDNTSRFFTLIYDFDIANGNFSKLVKRKNNDKLDKSANKYWLGMIDTIRSETAGWNWDGFDFEAFLLQLQFKRVRRNSLINLISSALIERFEISTGNEILYARSLFYLCFSKMRARETVSTVDFMEYILFVKDEINKGAINPAVHWLAPIDFEQIGPSTDDAYYEGKKADPSDIIAGLPIHRPIIEADIKKSIYENTITVIKSSSGQGKTTLAWQIAHDLKEQYDTYHLTWCLDTKELDYIVEYIRSRIKVGEIPIILIDNLDIQLKEWNYLAQLLQQKIGVNYKIVITSRETDWYTYSGDQSNLRNIRVINIALDPEQAKDIYGVLNQKGKVHPNIKNWNSAWEQIDGRGLLIEYVYLLTHGEALADRIASQMRQIEAQPDREVKFDILRKVCFSDTIGIQLSSDKLASYYAHRRNVDISSIMRGFENEFLICQTKETIYISGLHPVRSQHLLDFLHKFSSKTDTVLELLDIIDDAFVSKLYANLPAYISDGKEEFYKGLIEKTADKSYRYFVNAIQGLFSGSVIKYFQRNWHLFDEANIHGGLLLFLNEINPYAKFEKFDIEIKTLAEMKRIVPDDKNVAYLNSLVDKIEAFSVKESDYYIYAYYLHKTLVNQTLKIITDGFSDLVYWLINIEDSLNILSLALMDQIWGKRKEWTLQSLANLMISWYLAEEQTFRDYISANKVNIIHYLKVETNSVVLQEEQANNSIHVEYLLLPNKQSIANQESVNRLNLICRFLPIYDFYSASAIRPKADFLENLNAPDDSSKNMPRRNLIISFHQEFAKIWGDTISSNYEAPTVFDWLNHWFELRRYIVALWKKNVALLDKYLNRKKLSNNFLGEIDLLKEKVIKLQRLEYSYPRQNRPFEKKNSTPQELSHIKTRYFSYVRNYIEQMNGLFQKEEKTSRLAIVNLREARNKLKEMQSFFEKVAKQAGYYINAYFKLETDEELWLDKLLAYNLYHLEHKNNILLLPKQLDNWMTSKNVQLMYNIRQAIENFELSTVKFQYPSSRIDHGTLFTLPLIGEDIDVTNDQIAAELITSLIPIVDFEVDFVIIMMPGAIERTVKPLAMRISKDFLSKFKKVLEEDDASYIENASPPLPFEVGEHHIGVFPQELVIEETHADKSLENYDMFYAKLWEYAQLTKHLDQPNEQAYLAEMQDITRKEIDNLFTMLSTEQKVLHERATNRMKKVLTENYYYGNKEFNDDYNAIIAISNNVY